MSQGAVTETYGWVGDRGERAPEPTYTPDMAALIDGEDEETHDDLELCGEVMRGVFAHVFAQRGSSNEPVKLDLVFRRFVCLAWLIRPELLGNISLMQLAPHLSVTRASLSKMVREFGDTFGMRNALMKREGAREIYAEAQKRDHWRHRAKKKPVALCGTTGPNAEHSNGTVHSEVPHD
jgi:hypothetical protein